MKISTRASWVGGAIFYIAGAYLLGVRERQAAAGAVDTARKNRSDNVARAIDPATKGSGSQGLTVSKHEPARILGDLAAAADRPLALEPGQFPAELNRVLALPPGEVREISIKLLLRRWGQVDHEAAFGEIDGLANLNAVDSATYVTNVYEGWALVAPAAAWEATTAGLDALPESVGGGPATWGLSRTGIGGSGRLQAIALALTESSQHAIAGKLIAGSNALERNQDSHPTSSAAQMLAGLWGAIDPVATQEWISRLKGNARYNAVRVFTPILAERDKAAAERFAEEMEAAKQADILRNRVQTTDAARP